MVGEYICGEGGQIKFFGTVDPAQVTTLYLQLTYKHSRQENSLLPNEVDLNAGCQAAVTCPLLGQTASGE